jgi:two-component system chemotaxis response regulator CheY
MVKILAVDDSESFRIEIREILSRYEIIEAVDGVDALAKLASNPGISLIICDVNMPNMDGVTFCRKKSENRAYDKIPIIMITTESNAEIKKEVKNYGVKAWVLKPIDAQSLSNGVHFLLQNNAKQPA